MPEKMDMDFFYDTKKCIPKRKKKAWKLKRRLLTAGAAVFAVAVVAISGYTYSQLNTRTSSLDNELKFGQTGITVTENKYDWDAKEVKLTAAAGTDYVSGVARAMIVPYILDGAGSYISCDLSAMSEPVGNKMVLGDFTLEFDAAWQTYWFYKDGFFYYKEVLDPGDSTELLLKKVSLTNDTTAMREKYADAEIKVEVIAQILQAEGGAPQTEWGITVSGSAVLP